MIKINERWVQLQLASIGIPKGRAREYLSCMIMLDLEREQPVCKLYGKVAEQMGVSASTIIRTVEQAIGKMWEFPTTTTEALFCIRLCRKKPSIRCFVNRFCDIVVAPRLEEEKRWKSESR